MAKTMTQELGRIHSQGTLSRFSGYGDVGFNQGGKNSGSWPPKRSFLERGNADTGGGAEFYSRSKGEVSLGER